MSDQLNEKEKLEIRALKSQLGIGRYISQLITLAITGFVIFGNPDLSHNISAIMGVLAGVLGILPRLLPLLGGPSGATPNQIS